jgi:hypothetical protein
MNTTLQKKIDESDSWFHLLKERDDIDIHAVEFSPIFGEVVFWSDRDGYSYSYHSNSGQGVSGAYDSLVDCVKAIF